MRLTDLAAAQAAFEQALDLASEADLPFWRLRALHEIGTIELFGQAGARRLSQARQMAGDLGAMSTAAVLDLQLAAAADARFDLDELARVAQDTLPASFRGMWPVFLATTGDARAADEIRAAESAGVTKFFGNRGMACYAGAILAGRAGDAARAAALAADGDRALAAHRVWPDVARMLMAEAALADGWGEPRECLRAARDTFGACGLAALARRCGALLGEVSPGPPWADLGVTRERPTCWR